MSALPIFLATRLDWGFGNPNKTAALIVALMTAVWILPFVQRHLFWLALSIFTGLGVCLMETASRGGIFAAAFSLGILLTRPPRPWARAHMLGVVAAIWVMVGVAAWLPTLHRFSKGMSGQDLSITQRLELWRAAPRMMVDAPGGWGLGNAADIFHQWYQPLDQTQRFLSLVNSHLTWLVEIGWPARFLYVFGWFAVVALCWPTRAEQSRAPWLLITAAVWIGFAVTAWFSSVAESLWLWLLPAICLVCALGWRLRAREWPTGKTWSVIGFCTCALLGALFGLGSIPGSQPRLRLVRSRIVLGQSAEPAVWIVTNTGVLGQAYGRTLRKYLAATTVKSKPVTSIALIPSVDDLSPADVQARILVVPGPLSASGSARLKTLASSCDKLVLLNPAFFPQEVGFGSADPKIEVVSGEFSLGAGLDWAGATKDPIRNVEGAGDYLPHWPELVLGNSALLHK